MILISRYISKFRPLVYLLRWHANWAEHIILWQSKLYHECSCLTVYCAAIIWNQLDFHVQIISQWHFLFAVSPCPEHAISLLPPACWLLLPGAWLFPSTTWRKWYCCCCSFIFSSQIGYIFCIVTSICLCRTSKASPVIDASKPLPPQATFRGPYINTGSRDIGPDHQTYPKKWCPVPDLLFFLLPHKRCIESTLVNPNGLADQLLVWLDLKLWMFEDGFMFCCSWQFPMPLSP